MLHFSGTQKAASVSASWCVGNAGPKPWAPFASPFLFHLPNYFPAEQDYTAPGTDQSPALQTPEVH